MLTESVQTLCARWKDLVHQANRIDLEATVIFSQLVKENDSTVSGLLFEKHILLKKNIQRKHSFVPAKEFV